MKTNQDSKDDDLGAMPYVPAIKTDNKNTSNNKISAKKSDDLGAIPYVPLISKKDDSAKAESEAGPQQVSGQGFGDFAKGAGSGFLSSFDPMSMAQPFLHPVDTAVALKNLEVQTYQNALQNLHQGKYGEAANQAANLLLPGIGQSIDAMRLKAGQGDYKGAGEEAGNLFGSTMVAPQVYGKLTKAITGPAIRGTANLVTSGREATVGEAASQNVLNKAGKVDPSKLSSVPINTPQDAQTFLSLTGDQDTLSRTVLKNLVDSSSKSGKFDSKAALDTLNTNKSLYTASLPQEQLESTQRLLQRIDQLKSAKPSAQSSGLNVSPSGVILNFLGVSNPISKIALKAGTKISGLVLDKGLDTIVKNPTVSNALVQASLLPANSPKLQVLNQVVLNGLRGTSGLKVMDDQNKEHNAEIDDSGKIHVL